MSGVAALFGNMSPQREIAGDSDHETRDHHARRRYFLARGISAQSPLRGRRVAARRQP
ncbi:MAG: hypothetical protein JG774_195 [Desulfomicrobiaceae bacterium]|jgi:hypothetical protein|nr:hypothetical protein [Desulfomicrobiaceae bacterium]